MTAFDPMPDIPRLRKAVEWVETQATLPWVEREWDQAAFVPDRFLSALTKGELVDLSAVRIECGTAACVCGRIAIEEGVIASFNLNEGVRLNGMSAHKYGMSVLGITESEAWDLFDSANDATDVRRIAESIAARVGERL